MECLYYWVPCVLSKWKLSTHRLICVHWSCLYCSSIGSSVIRASKNTVLSHQWVFPSWLFSRHYFVHWICIEVQWIDKGIQWISEMPRLSNRGICVEWTLNIMMVFPVEWWKVLFLFIWCSIAAITLYVCDICLNHLGMLEDVG